MTDLIIHIGLPKCGSTTLQREVFAREQGYLGTHPSLSREDNLAKQLQQCGPFGGRQTLSRRGLHRWADRVRAHQKVQWPDVHRLIASDEVLGSKSRLEKRPIVRLLQYLNDEIWHEGAVRALIVFRNQAERLASGYAQGSNSRVNPGQKDFEAAVVHQLEKPGSLDYAALLHELDAALGIDNVCPLLLEETNTEGFWQTLKDFAGLQMLQPAEMVTGEGTQNRRRAGVDQWAISPFDAHFKAKVAVDKPLNLLWPRDVGAAFRAPLRERLINQVARRYERVYEREAVKPRETSIQLTSSVRARVAERVGRSNQALAHRLGRPIEALGYHTQS
ncbi:UNVERIFIED_CONTAM: sulfotransferase domain-containing protein [Spiribacter pallidus]